jgi:hypothetical protein
MLCRRAIAESRSALNGLAAVITIGIVLSLSSGSLEAAPTEREFLVVDGAQDVQEDRDGDTWWSVIYTIELTYPSTAIGEREWGLLEAAGWRRCQGASPDWFSFEDESMTPVSLNHRQVTYWARGNNTLTIALQYFSFGLERTKNAVPNNSQQLVTIAFDDGLSRRDSVAWRALRCP